MTHTLHPAAGKTIALVGTLAETLVGFRGELIKQWVAQGHRVVAIATNYDAALRESVIALGAEPVEYTLKPTGINPFAELRSLWQLYRLLKQLKPDVCFSYFVKPSIYGTLAAYFAKVPRRIAKIEGLGRMFVAPRKNSSYLKRAKHYLMVKLISQLFKISLAKAHCVVFLNPDDKHDLQQLGVALPPSEIIGGIGVCLESYPFNVTTVQPMRFIFVGRLLNEKGIRYYLQAAEQIKNIYPEAEFWVLGEPDAQKHALSRGELDAYVERGVVLYPGKVNNVLEYLQESSVFVLPSYYREGVPRSSQEALATGRAIITTNMPGCRDTVIQGVNGLLIEPHSVAALVQAMRYMLENPEQVIAMGKASAKLAQERFNVVNINKRLSDLL